MEEFFADDPFTQADSLQLQKVNQGLASLTSQVNDGILYDSEAKPDREEMLMERNQLLQKQQKAQLAQKGQQRMQLQDETANLAAMELANSQQNASQFMTTMPRFEDPDTGEVTYFYKKGEFEPLQKEQPVMPMDGLGIEGADQGTGENGPSGAHRMTIQNGPYQTNVDFQDGKTVGSQTTDLLGRGPRSHPGEMFGLGPETISNIKQTARIMAAGVEPRYRTRAVARFERDLMLQAKQQQFLDRKEQVMAQREAQKEQAIGERRFASEYRHHFNQLQREIDKFRHDNPTEEAVQAFAADPKNAEKSYLWDRSAHEAMARYRAEGATLDKHPNWVPRDEQSQKKAQPEPDQKKAFEDLMRSLMAPPKKKDKPLPDMSDPKLDAILGPTPGQRIIRE